MWTCNNGNSSIVRLLRAPCKLLLCIKKVLFPPSVVSSNWACELAKIKHSSVPQKLLKWFGNHPKMSLSFPLWLSSQRLRTWLFSLHLVTPPLSEHSTPLFATVCGPQSSLRNIYFRYLDAKMGGRVDHISGYILHMWLLNLLTLLLIKLSSHHVCHFWIWSPSKNKQTSLALCKWTECATHAVSKCWTVWLKVCDLDFSAAVDWWLVTVDWCKNY